MTREIEKMILRKLDEKDAKGMLEWMKDTEINKNFRFSIDNKNLQNVLDFIRGAEIVPSEGNSVHYAIADEADEYLGTISLKNFNMVDKNAEYAISLRAKAQGKGIASQATTTLLKIAFEDLNLERVYLNVLSDNKRAIRLYEKIGFVYEGEFRNCMFLRGEYKALRWYSILRGEYFMRGGVIRYYPNTFQYIRLRCNWEVA